MATLTNPTLSITSATPGNVRVRATVDVTFTASELQWIASGMIVTIKCTLFEQDSPAVDESLISFRKRVNKSMTLVFNEVIEADLLNTEPGDDEIYARFGYRVSGVPAPIKSPVIIIKNGNPP